MAQLDATQFPTSVSETYIKLDDLTGSVSTKVLTGSFWFKTSRGADAQVVALSGNAIGLQVYVAALSVTGNVEVTCRDSAGTIRLKMVSDTGGYDDGSWHHCAFSFDLNLATQDAQLFVDGASDMTAATTLSDAEIDFDFGSASVHRIGIDVTGPTRLPYDGCLTEYWLGWEHVVLSTAIGGFYLDGRAAPLGADGSSATGRQPEVYLTGGAADIVTNLGSGENFTAFEGSDALADCADGPEAYAIADKTVTRLGLYGGPRQLYGDFAPKVAAVEAQPFSPGGSRIMVPSRRRRSKPDIATTYTVPPFKEEELESLLERKLPDNAIVKDFLERFEEKPVVTDGELESINVLVGRVIERFEQGELYRDGELEQISGILEAIREMSRSALPATDLTAAFLRRFEPTAPDTPLSRKEFFEILARMQASVLEEVRAVQKPENFESEKIRPDFSAEKAELQAQISALQNLLEQTAESIQESERIRLIGALEAIEAKTAADRRRLALALAALAAA